MRRAMPKDPAFPNEIRVGTYQQADAKRRANLAAAHINTTRRIHPNNLRRAARNFEERAGLPPGSAYVRQSGKSNVYFNSGEHAEVNGWGGSRARTHWSSHPTSKDHRNTPIGSHHVKTEIGGEVIGQARSIPDVRSGQVSFDRLGTVTGRPNQPPGYERDSPSAIVAQAAAETATDLARLYPSNLALGSRGYPNGGAGGPRGYPYGGTSGPRGFSRRKRQTGKTRKMRR
jgi:hypothetical protein